MIPSFSKHEHEFLKYFFRKDKPSWIRWLFLFSKMVAPLILIPFLLLFASIGEADYMAYKDASRPVEARVKDLLGRMTLAEKIGQMTQIERLVATPDILKNYYIGKFFIHLFYGTEVISQS
jgi:putative effector of murein hydrolase